MKKRFYFVKIICYFNPMWKILAVLSEFLKLDGNSRPKTCLVASDWSFS